MEIEENLIPYHPADLTGKKVLVLAPHPDDETIGCGGSLIHHTDAGDPVKVVFLTNGAKGDTSGQIDREAYVAWRQEEAGNACLCLGVTDLEFWGYEDRSLAGSRGILTRMIDLLKVFQPELVYAPSPLEIHPDHRAACFLLSDAIRSSDADFEIAFYEIGQPISVNLLVDITPVLNKRIEAMEAYQSQLKERPYKEVSISLNRYRSITLPERVTHAEGYFFCHAGLLRRLGPLSIPFHRVHRLAPEAKESGPLVSVIVRTKDRPALLAAALESVRTQTYPNIEVILINDGGMDVRDVADAAVGDVPVTHIMHEDSRGRAAAANSGLKAAQGLYLNFLDDDDVLYPDHVKTLVQHLSTGETKVVYSSVLSAYFEGPPTRPETCIRQVVNHAIDFDPERLLFQNYIPLMSVMFHKDLLAEVGAFDTNLDLFEDWDFWIRASRVFRFHHVDKVTAEYRFYGTQTTEAAHQHKYRYAQAQARIFERVIPFLTGEIWNEVLRAGWWDELRVAPEQAPEKEQFNQGTAALYETVRRLNEAHDLIGRLRTENETLRKALDAIHTSRGWRWLNRCSRWKRRLGFGPSSACASRGSRGGGE